MNVKGLQVCLFTSQMQGLGPEGKRENDLASAEQKFRQNFPKNLNFNRLDGVPLEKSSIFNVFCWVENDRRVEVDI